MIKDVKYGAYLTVKVGGILFRARAIQQITDPAVAKDVKVPLGSWYLNKNFEGQLVIATADNLVKVEPDEHAQEFLDALTDETREF